jgi:hypothetical protein
MSQFNKDVFKEQMQLTGAFVPRSFFEKLKLLALYRSSTTSKIINEYLEKESMFGDDGVKTMIDSIARRGMVLWERRPIDAKFDDCKKMIRSNLKRKKIAQKHISLILQEMQKLYEANKRKFK